MKWIFFDDIITGDTPDEIVSNLQSGSRFASDQSIEDFMEGVSERIRDFNGCLIRFDTADNFVADIKSNGLLLPVN